MKDPHIHVIKEYIHMANTYTKKCSTYLVIRETQVEIMRCNNTDVLKWASQVAQTVKKLPAMRETGFNPWVGKIPRRRERLPTKVFLPEYSMDKGAWQATVHGVTKSWT